MAPVFRSRREARAAGAYSDAPVPLVEPTVPTVPAVSAQAGPTEGGIADLFPLLDPTPAEAPSTELSTQAMAVTEMAAELAAPAAPLVIHQEPIAPVVLPAPVVFPAAVGVTTASITIPPSPAHAPADLSAVFPAAVSDPEPEPPRSSRRGRRGTRAAGSDAPRGRAPRNRSITSAAAAADRKSIRQRITGFGVMVLVGGLFAVLALPAYAENGTAAQRAAGAVHTQKLDITAAAATNPDGTSRDAYSATSASDLKALYASALKQRNLAAYMQSGAKAAGDDYPWFAELSRNQGGGLSPLNYYYRECVDFVAWRLNRDAGSTSAPFKWVWSNLTPNGGNASQWKSAWLNHGWPTGTTPKVGAVAWFPYNHVGYVSGLLNDGSVLIEEYNWQGQHLYGTRVIQPADAYYLYAPPA